MTTHTYTIQRPEKLSLWERLYLPEIFRGMFITARHFFRNLFHMDKRMTIEFPEKKKQLHPGYRAEHRLMLREDGSVRCTACMLCATICAARCIEIEAEDVGDDKIESARKILPLMNFAVSFVVFALKPVLVTRFAWIPENSKTLRLIVKPQFMTSRN